MDEIQKTRSIRVSPFWTAILVIFIAGLILLNILQLLWWTDYKGKINQCDLRVENATQKTHLYWLIKTSDLTAELGQNLLETTETVLEGMNQSHGKR